MTFMRIFTATSLCVFFISKTIGQQTLVPSSQSENLDLACGVCYLKVEEISVTKGQHAVPSNLKKPVATNLLHWQYFDEILQKKVTTASEPLWTSSTQLLAQLPDTQMVSLHLNLTFRDSAGRENQLFMVLAGFTKAELEQAPLSAEHDPDTYAPRRFAAIAQIRLPDERKEIYDSIEGSCTLDELNLKTRALSGEFEFTGNRIGMNKHCFFTNGRFASEGQ